jgi:hypothetical protein
MKPYPKKNSKFIISTREGEETKNPEMHTIVY